MDDKIWFSEFPTENGIYWFKEDGKEASLALYEDGAYWIIGDEVSVPERLFGNTKWFGPIEPPGGP